MARALATRELRASTLAQALVARITAMEPALHAWSWFDAAAAQAQATALDSAAAQGPLHGLAIGVKDLIDTAGMPTSYGSAIYEGHRPHVDAACVALARAAGAWVMGKTVSTELANMTPAVTRNPHRLDHTPGGSSSGSAAAVSAGCVPLALGTQTAGSIIRPAAFCGIVGYKPSPRCIPRAGVKANADTLDEVGVLARSVDDAALLSRVLCSQGVDAALPSTQAFAPRIGVVLTSQQRALSLGMMAMVLTSAQRLASAGATVQELSWPIALEGLFEAQRIVQAFETARALSPELLYRREALSPMLLSFLDEARLIEPAAYAAARALALSAQPAVEALFAGLDVLIAPAAAGAAPRSLDTTGDPVFSRPWQLLGCPCITVPGGVDSTGMPLGLQVIARVNDDERLFAAAAWISRALDSEAITHSRCMV